MSPRIRAYLYLILVAVIWGSAGPVIKFTLKGIDPLPFLSYRFLISGIFSIIFFIVKIKKGKKFRKLRANFALAILYGLLAVPIALGTLFLGLDTSTVLDLTLIGVVGPLLVTAGGAIFFHDHVTTREKVGILLVITGVIINSFFPIFGPQSRLRLTGNIFLLVYLLADSASILVAKKAIQKGVKSANLTNLAFLAGAAILIPITIFLYGANNFLELAKNLPLKYHLGVWYMALFSGSLAYFLYVRATRTIEVSEAVLFFYLQPVFSVPLAVFWLGEEMTLSFIIGAWLIISGLTIGEWKKSLSQPKT